MADPRYSKLRHYLELRLANLKDLWAAGQLMGDEALAQREAESILYMIDLKYDDVRLFFTQAGFMKEETEESDDIDIDSE